MAKPDSTVLWRFHDAATSESELGWEAHRLPALETDGRPEASRIEGAAFRILNPELVMTNTNRWIDGICQLLRGFALVVLISCSSALAVDGTFTVTEDWVVKLTYSGWGDQNFSGTRQYNGRQTGTINVVNGDYRLIDQTGIPGGTLIEYADRGIGEFGQTFRITGDRVMPHLAAGASLFGIVYLGGFIVKVPLVDGEIPTFSQTSSFSASGSSLTSLKGSGSMSGPSLNVSVTTTTSFALAPAPPAFSLHPANQTVIAGGEARFTVIAGGNPAPVYQWQRKPRSSGNWANLADGVSYSGTRTNALSVKGTTAAMDGDQFRCVASNSRGSGNSNPAILTVQAVPPIWSESWQKSVARRYTITDTTYDTILGDSGNWVVNDGADVCGPGPHPNAAEVLANGTTKVLLLNVASSACSVDLAVESAQPLSIPILTNTVISMVQTGTLDSPSWNGFFPTLFPPPGDNVRLVLMDQDGNRVVYLFQRAANYRAHTDTFPVELPDGHIASAGYREVLLGDSVSGGGKYARNLYDDFAGAPGFNPSGAKVIHVEIGITSLGTATFDELKIGTGIPLPPAIVAQPADLQVVEGKAASFAVAIKAPTAVRYQWQRLVAGAASWIDLPASGGYSGVTNATLLIGATTLPMNGDRFRCVISDSGGVAISDPATLTVTPLPSAPAFTVQPKDWAGTEGTTAAFTVSASGTEPPALQWHRRPAGSGSWLVLTNVGAYSGVRSSTLIVSNILFEMTGDQFRCLAESKYGSATSEAGTLTVEKPVVVPIQLTEIARGNDGSLKLTMTSGKRLEIEIQESTDLILWTTNQVATNELGTISVQIENLNTGPINRFFRARLRP